MHMHTGEHLKKCTYMHKHAHTHTYWSIHHVRSFYFHSFDSLKDINLSLKFNFNSLNFRNGTNEHTTSPHTVTNSLCAMHWRVKEYKHRTIIESTPSSKHTEIDVGLTHTSPLLGHHQT